MTPGNIVNPSNGVGLHNPNDPSGWYATNLGGDHSGHIRPVSGEEFRLLTDSTHSNRALLQSAAKIAAMIYGGAALSGAGAGGPAAGIHSAGLGFGGSAAGLAPVSVPSAGAYLPAESISGSAAPTLGMTAPADASAVGTGGGSNGGFSFKKLFHMGGSGSGGQRQQQRPYQDDQTALIDEQQRTAQMLAEALRNRQPVNMVVPGGPTPVSPFGAQRYG